MKAQAEYSIKIQLNKQKISDGNSYMSLNIHI